MVSGDAPHSPMYTNGRLTKEHRERLQRILTKQEMSSTTKRAFRTPRRGNTPMSGMRRQRSVPRIQTPYTPVSRRVNTSQSQARPATTALTRRPRPRPPSASGTGSNPLSPAIKSSPKFNTTAGTSRGEKSAHFPLKTAPKGAAKFASGEPSARSSNAHHSSRAHMETPPTEDRNLHTGCFISTRDYKYTGRDDGSAGGLNMSLRAHHTSRAHMETPPTEDRNLHTGCFMRTRDNKYLPPDTPKISDAEVTSLLNQQRLKDEQARSNMPDRSPTATLLYGCRVEGALSPDATPRPTRLMEERDAAKGVGGMNWISIVEHNQRLAARDDLINEKMEKAVRNEFKDKLAKQREQCHDALRREVEDREREKQRLSSMYQQWHKEDEENEKLRLKRVQQLKIGYHQQLSALEQRRRYEQEKWRRREQRQVDALKASLEEERQQAERKKIETKEKMLKMVAENSKNGEIRRAEALREQAEDIRLHKERVAQMEREEQQRRAAKARIKERQNKNVESLLAATKSFKQQAEEDAKRAEREHVEARLRMDRIEREKREHAEHNQRQTNAVILRQQEEKEAQQKQDRAEWRLYGDYINKDAELYAEEQRHVAEARRRKAFQQTEVLREQVKLNHQRKLAERADMSENERLYNQSLLNECKKSLKAHVTNSEEEITTSRMGTRVDKHSPFKWREKNRPRPF